MKTAWFRHAGTTFRLRDVREPTASDMLDAGRSPSEAHLYVVGIAPGLRDPGLYEKKHVTDVSEWSVAYPPASKRRPDTEWYEAIQYTNTFSSEAAADEALVALSQQDGFIAGRTARPSGPKPGWRVQAFFAMETLGLSSREVASLPANMRRVRFKDSMLVDFMRKG